ncbi:MAG: DNA mismatch repair protein MutS, partial [Phycisphaerae bacterium]|nr:DNA mismatch repair protein MutS [Phycisphaerae bacterium]
MLTDLEDWVFEQDYSLRQLIEHFEVQSLDGFGCGNRPLAIIAGGALLHQLQKTQKRDLSHITTVRFYTDSAFMQMDEATLRNLEITRSAIDGKRKGSLLWLMDLTQTAMGARLLRRWLLHPLINVKRIDRRLDAVLEFKDNFLLRDEVRQLLKSIRDIERLISRIDLGTANARDLVSLRESLSMLPKLYRAMSKVRSPLLASLVRMRTRCPTLRALWPRRSLPSRPLRCATAGCSMMAGMSSLTS